MIIHPQQLRISREAKGWSRQKLAETARVSERQIARIETGDEPVNVRETTHNRLREALGGFIDASAKSELEAVAPSFDGDSLRFHRKSSGLSRKQLALKSKVSVRQIERLEEAGTEASPRRITVNRLAAALQLKPSAFSQRPKGPVPSFRGIKSRTLRSQVSPQVGIAYDLVCQRYGISGKVLMELAPLLFTLLAECSLSWRKRVLEEMSAALDRPDEIQAKNPHLWFGFLEDRHDWGLAAERKSIESLDLLGTQAAEGVAEEYNDILASGITPFLNYLRKLADESGGAGLVDLNEVSDPETFEWFASSPVGRGCSVCDEEFERLTGGSERAKFALRTGDVAISAIPEALLSDESTSERIAWLEAKLNPDAWKSAQQRLEAQEWFSSRLKFPR